VPQTHAPAAEQPSADSGVHAEHAAPGAPHAVTDGVVQVLPLQQPSGHEVTSHTHEPCEQWSPCRHGAPVPQRQSPVPEQLSASAGSHATQLAPPVPHVFVERSSQVWFALQQPLGHDVASHTQRPPAQRCPSPQGAPPPHVHVPLAEQPSLVVASHAMQALPPVPQVAVDGM
jgi:hypothetical protein